MGIHNLAKLIADHASNAIKESDIKNYFGRKIAIDASMSIYQFLIAVRQEGNQLTSDSGETTSHLNGLFYRTIRLIDNGIKPVYVFDGKPPQLKSLELGKRQERREAAQKEHEAAVEAGDTEAMEKFGRRLVKVTREQNDECKRLLKLMGVPFVEAPCEAEAQCAAMVKQGLVYATATEDMDGLTFGTPILLRHMTFSEAKKMPIQEFHLDKILKELNFTMEEFIDLCILLGCDYCDSIRGIGQKRAFELIEKHKSIDEVIKHLDQNKYPLPEDWLYKEARELFRHHEVADADKVEPLLKWNEPDEEGLVEFLVKEKSFNEDRVRNSTKKLQKSRKSATQGRLDAFFTVSSTSMKRKAEDEPPAKKNASKSVPKGRQKK